MGGQAESGPCQLDANEWKNWSLSERMDWCARDVSKNGMGVRAWQLSIAIVKLLFFNLLFLLLLYMVPPTDGLHSASGQWQIWARYSIYIHVLLALGECDGPPNRWTGGVPGTLGTFCSAQYRWTRGTMKTPFFRCFGGNRRTALDVAVYITLIVASSAAVVSADFPVWPVRIVSMCVAWFLLFDFGGFMIGFGATFYGVLFSLCLPMDSGGRACAQFHILALWIGAGLGKMGPWFANVNGTFICASWWFKSMPWLWRLMYRGENDLRPTLFAEVMSYLAATCEWGPPMVLIFATEPILIWSALFVLVSMHIYIIMLVPNDLHMWNSFTAVAGVCLFLGGHSLGFDYAGWSAAPWYFKAFNASQFVLFLIGSFFPDRIDYAFAHRPWAGNWPTAIWLLRKDASAKFTSAVPMFGQPSWDPVPAVIKKSGWLGPAAAIPELALYKSLGFRWLTCLNFNYSPVLIKSALGQNEICDYHVFHQHQFAEMLFGCGKVQDPTRCQTYIENVQELAEFQEGELICVWVGAFPAPGVFPASGTWGNANWKIMDAKQGVMSSGSFSVQMAQMVGNLPSASSRAEALVSDQIRGA